MSINKPTYITITDEPILDDEIDKYSRFYAYGPAGYHSGGPYIVKTCAPKSSQYIAFERVRPIVEIARITGQEIRITNSSDYLTYWLVDGKVLHPMDEEAFWQRLEAKVPARL